MRRYQQLDWPPLKQDGAKVHGEVTLRPRELGGLGAGQRPDSVRYRAARRGQARRGEALGDWVRLGGIDRRTHAVSTRRVPTAADGQSDDIGRDREAATGAEGAAMLDASDLLRDPRSLAPPAMSYVGFVRHRAVAGVGLGGLYPGVASAASIAGIAFPRSPT